MKLHALCIGLITLALSANAASANEYKCHATRADGSETILFAEGKTMEQARARLVETPARSRYDRRSVATRILECQRLNDEFRDARARDLDAVTPR